MLAPVVAALHKIPENQARAMFREEFENVRANLSKLGLCKRPHEFIKQGEGLRAKHRCTKCGGEVDALYADWYNQGLEDGKQ